MAGGSLKREEPGKTHLHGVAPLTMIESARQERQAGCAYASLLLRREGGTAKMAYSRKDEIEKRHIAYDVRCYFGLYS